MTQVCLQKVTAVLVMASLSFTGSLGDNVQWYTEHQRDPPIKIPQVSRLVGEVAKLSELRSSVNVPTKTEQEGGTAMSSKQRSSVNVPMNSKPVENTADPPRKPIRIPLNSQQIPPLRFNGEIVTCEMEGVFGLDCQHFYICELRSQPDNKPLYQANLFKCDPHLNFFEANLECLDKECYTEQYVQVYDPGMPAPPPETSQVPSWFNSLPAWFNSTPWWFYTAPAWFHTPPAWFNAPPAKPQTVKEEIQIETGEGIHPGSITKEITIENDPSESNQGDITIQDDKTLRIHIPIKIVQQ